VSKIWLEAFTDRMKEAGIKAKAKYDRAWSPKEYNYGGDKACFALLVTKAEIARLAAQCLADGNFEGLCAGHTPHTTVSGAFPPAAYTALRRTWKVGTARTITKGLRHHRLSTL
jgi:hypothetical protein